MNSEFYTINEICAKFNLYRHEVVELIDKGLLPHHQTIAYPAGKKVARKLWCAADVDTAMKGYVSKREYISKDTICKEFHIGQSYVLAYIEDVNFPTPKIINKKKFYSRSEVSGYLQKYHGATKNIEKEIKHTIVEAALKSGADYRKALRHLRKENLVRDYKYATSINHKQIQYKVRYVLAKAVTRENGIFSSIDTFAAKLQVKYNLSVSWVSLCARLYGTPSKNEAGTYDEKTLQAWLLDSVEKLRECVPDYDINMSQASGLLGLPKHLLRKAVPCRSGVCKLQDVAKVWKIPNFRELLNENGK